MERFSGDLVELGVLTSEYAGRLAEFMADTEGTLFIDNLHKNYLPEDEENYISSDPETKRIFGIFVKKSRELIGLVELINISFHNGTAEMGIFIGDPRWRNRGAGEEAIRLILDYGFYVLHLHGIHLITASFNYRGLHLYEKIGFKRVGAYREARRIGDFRGDVVLMDILKSEHQPYRLKETLDTILEEHGKFEKTISRKKEA